MGIWRVVKGDIWCDNCEKHVATIEFDAAEQVSVERIRVWCDDCRKPKPDKEKPPERTEEES